VATPNPKPKPKPWRPNKYGRLNPPVDPDSPDADRGVRVSADEAEFHCAECGNVAGRLTLDGGVANLSGFIGVIVTAIGKSGHSYLRRVFKDPRPLTADVCDFRMDFVPFFCRTCRRTYCREHWRPNGGPTTTGTCPRGHYQLLDD
jgi:hypothetical protein